VIPYFFALTVGMLMVTAAVLIIVAAVVLLYERWRDR